MSKRLILLLCLLLVQVTGWFWFSSRVPYLDKFWRSEWHPEKLSMQVEMDDYRVGRMWASSVVFDLESSRWAKQDRYDLRHEFAAPDRLYYWRLHEHVVQKFRTAELIDKRTGHVLKSREVPLLSELVDHRWVVYEDDSRLFWLDLDKEQAKFEKVEGLPGSDWVYWHSWSGPSLVLQREVSSGKGSTSWVHLVQFNEQGARVVAAWSPCLSTTNYYEYLDAGETIASWDAVGKALEFRSKANGQLIHTEIMPSGIDIRGMQWGLPAKVVHIQSPEGLLNYDLVKRQWIEVPRGMLFFQRSQHDQLCLLSDQQRSMVVYDRKQKKMLPLSFPRGQHLHIHDQNLTVSVDDSDLITFRFFNNQDGKLIRTYAPFAHVPWLLTILLLSFLVWAWFWLRESSRSGWSSWVDVLLVIGLPTLMFAWRQAVEGPPWIVWRLPYSYMFGGTVGVLAWCSIWFALGDERWPKRLWPLLIVEALAVLMARFSFSGQVDLMWGWLITLNLSICALLLLLFLYRWLGWRLSTAKGKTADAKSTKSAGAGGPTRLLDYFVLVLGVALILAAAGSEMSLRQITFIRVKAWVAVVAIVWPTVVTLGLSTTKAVFAIAIAVSFCLLMALMAEPYWRWFGGIPLERLWPAVPDIRYIFASVVAASVGLLPYRLRGWRLSRVVG